jgi:hypothetical protein
MSAVGRQGEGLFPTEAVWKRSQRLLQRRVDASDRRRLDFLDLAKG